MNHLRGLGLYRHAIAAGPLAVGLVLVLASAASLLEGAAIVLIVPLIEIAAAGTPSSGSQSLAAQLVLAPLVAAGVPLSAVNLLLAFAAVGTLSAGLNYSASAAIYRLVAATDADMRRRLFGAIMAMEWTALARLKSGELLKSLTSDPIQASLGLYFLLYALTMAVAAAVYLAVALLLAWKLTLVALAFGVIVLPLYLGEMRRARTAAASASEADAALTAQGNEALGHAKLLFSQGLRGFMIDRYGQSLGRYRAARALQEVRVERGRAGFEGTAILFVAGLLLLVVVLGEWPIATALVFLALFYRLAPRLVSLQGCLYRAANHAAWVGEWFARLEACRQAPAPQRGSVPPHLDRSLSFERLSYRYPEVREPVLHEASFELRRGEALAIVGASGQGKSTLIDLVTGLLTPQAGEVRLDGTPLQSVDLPAWQRRIGLVPQEAALFHGSIAENIAFAEPLDQARLAEAARLADAAEFIAAQPDGFATLVGERGVQLSGGQRQRIALARALYRRPALLVLDEGTSALDDASAARVARNLASIKPDLAMLIITHGQALLGLADRVMAMDGGRLIADEPARSERQIG
ncbi:MAG: ABC transporter ATP-binding protein [Alphaproteobacteria bacterium]|nr:ABC transporter ATP-binding protein [Alphaproteobacteria bacterium]